MCIAWLKPQKRSVTKLSRMNGKATSSKWTYNERRSWNDRRFTEGESMRVTAMHFQHISAEGESSLIFSFAQFSPFRLAHCAIWCYVVCLARTGYSINVCVRVCMNVNSKQYTDNIAYWVFVFHCRFIHWLMWLQHFNVCVCLHNICFTSLE